MSPSASSTKQGRELLSIESAKPGSASKSPRSRWFAALMRPILADRAMFKERPFQGMLFYIWLYPFTPAGKVVMVALAISAAAGSITDDMPIYQLPVTLLVLVLVTSAVASMLRWMSVSISGNWPDRVTAGQPLRIDFTVTNESRWPLLDVAVECFKLPSSWKVHRDERMVPTLPPGQSVTLSIRVTPHRRGVYQIPPLRAFSTFPFNLFRNQLGRKELPAVLVLPKFESLARINLKIGNRYQPGGVSFTSQIGESPEYIGNRDYMPGDSPRHIDFRSWARLARPVVREFQEEYFHRLGLVLDTFVPRRWLPWRRDVRSLEAAISLTASVADVFSRGEHLLDVFAAGPDLHVFRTGRNTTPISAVLEILANVPACHENPFDRIGAGFAAELPHISSIVCIFLTWDESRRQLVQAALDHGCVVKVILINELEGNSLPLALPETEVIQLTPAQIEAGIGEL